jgi:hypothetical protein
LAGTLGSLARFTSSVANAALHLVGRGKMGGVKIGTGGKSVKDVPQVADPNVRHEVLPAESMREEDEEVGLPLGTAQHRHRRGSAASSRGTLARGRSNRVSHTTTRGRRRDSRGVRVDNAGVRHSVSSARQRPSASWSVAAGGASGGGTLGATLGELSSAVREVEGRSGHLRSRSQLAGVSTASYLFNRNLSESWGTGVLVFFLHLTPLQNVSPCREGARVYTCT